MGAYGLNGRFRIQFNEICLQTYFISLSLVTFLSTWVQHGFNGALTLYPKLGLGGIERHLGAQRALDGQDMNFFLLTQNVLKPVVLPFPGKFARTFNRHAFTIGT